MKKKHHRAQDVFGIGLERVQYSSGPHAWNGQFLVATKEEQGAVVRAYLDWMKDPSPEHRIVEINWTNPLAVGNTPKTGTTYIDLTGVIALHKWRQAVTDPVSGR